MKEGFHCARSVKGDMLDLSGVPIAVHDLVFARNDSPADVGSESGLRFPSV
jgi:hypothetical protein